MEVVVGTPSTLAQDTIHRMAVYRHRIFVEMLGWQLPSGQSGIELDQFDCLDTMYMIARQGDDVVGVARLLPTHRPYLLKEVFPHLMGGLPLPNSPDVWELSRFTAIDLSGKPPEGCTRQVSSPIAVGLLTMVLQVAAAHGVQRLITVSPLGIERLLRRSGFLAHRAAPPVTIAGQPTYACWIEVPQQRSD